LNRFSTFPLRKIFFLIPNLNTFFKINILQHPLSSQLFLLSANKLEVAKSATVLRYFFVEFLRLVNPLRKKWRNTGRYRLGRRKYLPAGRQASLFDYLCDNNFCLVVMPAVFFDGMLVNNFVSKSFLNEPCYSLGEVYLYNECLVVRAHNYFKIPNS